MQEHLENTLKENYNFLLTAGTKPASNAVRFMESIAKSGNKSQKTSESDQKLSEAILYIAKQCVGDHFFGAVKLNKILFFTDFFSYVRNGEPVTGSDYMKLRNGPVPKRFLPVKEALVAKGRARVEPRPLINGAIQKRLIPLDQPDVSVFTARDIDMIHEVIDWLRFANADEVSEMSHDRAWRVAKMHEIIPYETAFVSDQEPSDEQLSRAKELSRRHKWDA